MEEVQLANFVDHFVHLAHVDHQLAFDCRFALDLKLSEEFRRHINERLLGPWEDPVNCALVEERWELLCTLSELVTDGRESKDHVEVVLDSSDEVVPESEGARVFALLSNFPHVEGLAHQGYDIFVFFGQKTWDFSSGEMGVDGFEEGLLLDLCIGHQESDWSALWTSLLVQLFDLLKHVVETVVFRNYDLEQEVLADECSKSRQGLLS